MKKLILVFAIFLVGFNVIAQRGSNKSPEQRAQRTSVVMQKKLGLTDDQKNKVYQASLERITQLEAMKAQNLDKSALLQQSKPIRDKFTSSLKSILTPAQYTLWEKLKSERKNKRRNSTEN